MGNRIALLDDHPLVRRALRALLESNGYTIALEASSVRELELALGSTSFDLLIADLGLRGPGGTSAIAATRRSAPRTAILVLTVHRDPLRVAGALAAGAHGYALKAQDEGAIVAAVRTVLGGHRYLAPELDATAVDALLRAGANVDAPLQRLSLREREIFDLVVRGHSTEGIARQLYISARTVDTHRSHIFDKLGVHSIAELVRLAARHGLLGPDDDIALERAI